MLKFTGTFMPDPAMRRCGRRNDTASAFLTSQNRKIAADNQMKIGNPAMSGLNQSSE